MTKKEATKPAPLLYMFEQILDGHGLFMDSKDWKRLQYSMHSDWVKPLLDLGVVREVSCEPSSYGDGTFTDYNYYKYEVVRPEGIVWWARERTLEAEKQGPIRLEILHEPWSQNGSRVEGKGIGSPIKLWWGPWIDAGIKGIRDGLFELVGHDNGHPAWWRMGESITVSLTPSGMSFFDSIPILTLECA